MSLINVQIPLKLIVALLLLTLLSTSLYSQTKPNVVLIMADDVGYECFGAYGSKEYKTPILDQLAKDGALFNHCYSQPLCTPSRVKIMTGRSNVRNYVGFGILDRKEVTFGNLFSQHGYETCIAGKWQLGKEKDAPQNFGFKESFLWQHFRAANTYSVKLRRTVESRYHHPRFEVNGKEVDFNDGEFGPDKVTDYICDFIERKKDKPFFVYYPMILPHSPFVTTPESANAKETDKKRNFVDMVQYIDKLVGRIDAKLKSLNLKENTLLIFTGDNGTNSHIVSNLKGQKIRGGKNRMTDTGTRVPLIVSWPAKINKGLMTDSLVDFSDILPTICDVAGITIPDDLVIDGKSFEPVLTGEKQKVRDWAYVWSKDKKNKIQQWARTERYKLYGTGKFFDLSKDPLERKTLKNLSPEAEKARQLLQKALNQYKDLKTVASKKSK